MIYLKAITVRTLHFRLKDKKLQKMMKKRNHWVTKMRTNLNREGPEQEEEKSLLLLIINIGHALQNRDIWILNLKFFGSECFRIIEWEDLFRSTMIEISSSVKIESAMNFWRRTLLSINKMMTMTLTRMWSMTTWTCVCKNLRRLLKLSLTTMIP